VAQHPTRRGAPAEVGALTLHRTMSRGKHMFVDMAGRGSALLCVTVEFVDGTRSRSRCVDATPRNQKLSIPTAPIDSVWVRACGPSRTARITPLHRAIGRRLGG